MNINFVGNKPQRMTVGAAGSDLSADNEYLIMAGKQVMIDTGTAIQLPKNTVGMLVPRSSLCNKNGLLLMNSVGVLDEDYTGTIKFCYRNISDTPVLIRQGERIGQIVVLPYIAPEWNKVSKLNDTARGNGGFGSTGEK